ncbi:hypothetical protein L0337_13295 [candidate division KSB1 bacterium]|nr:hypothetical protein [candidate division KSB1 bacterium]
MTKILQPIQRSVASNPTGVAGKLAKKKSPTDRKTQLIKKSVGFFNPLEKTF